jgi:rhomboid family GlyGly-CTERM serine protease
VAPRLRLIAPWVALALGLALGALAAAPLPPSLLEWRADSGPGEGWRLLSAALAHLGPTHLAANLAGCAVVGALGATAGLRPRWAVAWATAWPLTHAVLGAWPGLTHYAGLSGVLHAGVAVAAVGLLFEGRGRARVIGAAVLAGTLLKVALEQPWVAPVQRLPGWDFPVAVAAHATGVGVGMLCALACGVGGALLRRDNR